MLWDIWRTCHATLQSAKWLMSFMNEFEKDETLRGRLYAFSKQKLPSTMKSTVKRADKFNSIFVYYSPALKWMKILIQLPTLLGCWSRFRVLSSVSVHRWIQQFRVFAYTQILKRNANFIADEHGLWRHTKIVEEVGWSEDFLRFRDFHRNEKGKV